MFMDFATLAMDAIVNQAAKAHFMFGGQCSLPMVIRMPHGGGLSAGPQHSQCLEAWFAHVPGLKVVCPSDTASAYALLRAAIADPNPVIFVEQKARYATKGELPDKRPVTAIGRSRTLRAGRDVTVVAYGSTVDCALAASEMAAAIACDVEVIDLQSIQPWDSDAVVASVARTHRLVIAHEATQSFGVGAEIAAYVGEHAFDDLDAPVLRVGAPFMPVPFSKSMERDFAPSAQCIVDAIHKVME
jgi:acetoin:2,6-dichlorophenolindophenol oxidoreductase subunit beta